MELRDYQKEALNKIIWAQQFPDADLVSLPTGSGKSVLIAAIAHTLKQPVLILQPSREILEQNRGKLSHYVDPREIGTYSASMNEKTINFYTFATIQSIYKKPEDFKQFKLVIIDECHLVNPKNLEGMFTKFLAGIGSPKVIGLTATPYRTDITYRREIGRQGFPVLMCYPTIKLINRTKSPFWSRLIYNINNEDLLAQGFLTPLNYVDFSTIPQEEMPMNKSKTDFDLDGIEKKFVKWDDNIIKAINHGRTLSKSGSVLVFCSSIAQCKRLKEVYGDDSAIVHALTPKDERKELVDRFRAGTLPVMLNMGVFTLGFDHPALDCIVLGRPTQSIGLYYQMLGRGVRIAPGKDVCHVIDITNTVKKLGRIETIRLIKEAGSWQLVSETGYWHNACLYKFEIRK
jgi:DNA repair protein RadD